MVGFKYYFCLLTKPNKLFYYIFIYLRFNSHLWSICEPLIVTNVIIITRLFFPFISFLEIILVHNTIFSPLIHIFCMIRDESYGLYKKKYILSIVKFCFKINQSTYKYIYRFLMLLNWLIWILKFLLKILRNVSCVTRLITLILIIKKNYIKNPLRIINIIFIST